MEHRFGRRSAAAALAVLAVGLLASGCDWNQLGGSSAHNGDDAFDTTITPANVSTLTARFSATDGSTGALTPQAVVNGILYGSNAAGLEAYSANGTTGCAPSPVTCAPLWTYATGPLDAYPSDGLVAVVNGVVYASTSSGLEAFDAAGQSNCSGTPTLCQPLWSAPGVFGTPTVSNNTVYVTTSGSLESFDATGRTNCSGTPKVCSPIWSTTVPGDHLNGTVTVSAGIAYVDYDNGVADAFGVLALDANGSRGCSGTPTVCSPLWYDPTGYDPADSPIVLGTTLYVSTGGIASNPARVVGGLEAFDANGVMGCTGTPKYCAPLWSGFTGSASSGPLVAGDGSVFAARTGSGDTLVGLRRERVESDSAVDLVRQCRTRGDRRLGAHCRRF